MAWFDEVRQVRYGTFRRGEARYGMLRYGGFGKVWIGLIMVRCGRFGEFRWG
jgi:hypothetical protein